MFDTTHDIILLFIAAVYLIVWVLRTVKAQPGVRYLPGTFVIPLAIATTCFLVAVAW